MTEQEPFVTRNRDNKTDDDTPRRAMIVEVIISTIICAGKSPRQNISGCENQSNRDAMESLKFRAINLELACEEQHLVLFGNL
ncbi:hypothetical protein N7447_010778 [Penicillium robsamsonii]|uniref:uncharacterized protein n=1 Tax=Penicillium robsamsonii TaxID=1792511 RepID=UPI0025481680|nr:uncharacterized protein N7447_010778 [Penicillium robsamsonii]KAJ5807322.1 hypothetical protein N7447_010778 [Penicillium robsamsonii]